MTFVHIRVRRGFAITAEEMINNMRHYTRHIDTKLEANIPALLMSIVLARIGSLLPHDTGKLARTPKSEPGLSSKH